MSNLLDTHELLSRWENNEPEDVALLWNLLPSLVEERDKFKAGVCLDVIAETFIACGEGDNFCSETCRLRARLRFAWKSLKECIATASEGWAYASDYFRDKWDADGQIAKARAALAELAALQRP